MAATTMATMAVLNSKCVINPINSSSSSPKLPTKSISLKNLSKLPPFLTSSSVAGTAIAGAIFSTLSASEPAMAAQQLALLAAEGGATDNRGLALLLPIVPAVAWVVYNILQPALNQINKMANSKGIIVGLGLGSGMAAADGGGFISTPQAAAAGGDEIATLAAEAAAAAGSDNRGTLLLLVVAPAILWVLYNILQPALNQFKNMSEK